MKRAAIVGCCGAGKSTFAQKLTQITALPLHHLDTIFWTPGWKEQRPDIFEQKLNEWLKNDLWIIDGNYARTAEQRFKRADTIFFFDLPVWLCFLRMLKRVISSYGKSRNDMANGCTEHLGFNFMAYVLKFKKETRPRIISAIEQHAKHCQIITFKKPNDAKRWLKTHYESH